MMPDEPDSLVGLLQQHLSWYPLMKPRDIYKLLYQGVMGSEHLISSPEEFTRRLHLEINRLQPKPLERLFEPVRPDQTLLRLNLRPHKSHHLGIDRLSPSLLETTRFVTGDLSDLKATWLSFIQYCETGQITNFKIGELHQVTRWLEKMEFPLVHHSETYRREYQPAYRLIAAKFVSGLRLEYAG
jgi:hypothetical protein